MISLKTVEQNYMHMFPNKPLTGVLSSLYWKRNNYQVSYLSA